MNFSRRARLGLKTPQDRVRRLLPALFGALAFTLLAPTHASALDDDLLGALKRVEKVRIEGNHSVKKGAIEKVIKTGSGSFLGLRSLPLYRPDFLRSDATTIQNLYVRRGFPDVEVAARADSGQKPGRVIVTFTVKEGPRVLVRSVAIDTSAILTADELRKLVKIKPGDPYDPVQVVLDRTAIADRFADRGHFPTIESEAKRDSNVVDVHFRLVDGPAYTVRDVRIQGVAEVDTHAVRRELLLKPGELFRRDRLVKSSERLYETALFNAVEVIPTEADTLTGRVSLMVRVRERQPRWVEGGIGVGSYEKIRLGAEWGNRNVTGDGKALTANLSWGYYKPELYQAVATLAFVEPWLFGRRVRGRIAPSAEYGFEEFASRTYVQFAYGLSFGVSRDFAFSESRISLVLDNTWTPYTEIIRQDPADTSTFFVPPYVRRWTLGYDQDRRDNALDSHSGSIVLLTAQLNEDVNGTQGPYVKLESMTGWHVPTGPRSSIGLRARVGYITAVGSGEKGDEGVLDRVPVPDRYRTGGASTVRGYHENGIDGGGDGGRMSINTTVEWRVPVKGVISLGLFLDAGNVWQRMNDIKFERFFTPTAQANTYGVADYRWSAGIGLRIGTPIGPLRFDYGRRLHIDEVDYLAEAEVGRKPDRGALHFSLGQMF